MTPTETGDPPWEAFALLAVTAAMMAGLSVEGGRRALAKLGRIAVDWERPDARPVLGVASRRFIRPALALLGRERG